MAELHVIRDTGSLANIPEKLRQLADAIEKGEHGTELRAVVVLRLPDGVARVFGFGQTADACHAFEDLHLGAATLLNALKPE